MSDSPNASSRPDLPALLVTAGQLGLILAIVVTGPIFPSSPGPLALMAAGLALLAWTLLHNRLGNFNIHPDIRPQSRLITTGPYRFIRHPMYTGIMLTMIALVIEAPSTERWILLAGLTAVLLMKIRFEERNLLGKFPEYADYRRKTNRLIPFLF